MDQRVVGLALRRAHRPGQVFAVQGEAGIDAASPDIGESGGG
ncbi:hypothetical protein [Streptomyces sp. NA02950]|nr:hypothetical protein [Streptomyces sp. NA02950]